MEPQCLIHRQCEGLTDGLGAKDLRMLDKGGSCAGTSPSPGAKTVLASVNESQREEEVENSQLYYLYSVESKCLFSGFLRL